MYRYEIRVQGHLDQHWSAWLEGLAITYDADDNTVLSGPLVDEAALHGVQIKVRDLSLPLLGVHRLADSAAESSGCQVNPIDGAEIEGPSTRVDV